MREETTRARLLAPNLCGGLGESHTECKCSANIIVHAAYAEWGEHHNTCDVCGRHDWYLPGGVLLRVSPLHADGVLRLSHNGHVKEVTYRRGFDLGVLCPEGAELFERWLLRAMDTSMSTR